MASRKRPPLPLHVVILAAGQGTRMKSDVPKVLHPIAGKPMLGHVLDSALELGAAACHVVVGHGAETLRAWIAQARAGERITLAEQAQQLGTAHAVQQAMPQIPDASRVLVLYGDVPLLRAETLAALLRTAGDGLGILTAELPDPSGYGRIWRGRDGAVRAIVEHADATPAQRGINEVNTGVITVPAKRLRGWLSKVRNENAKGEFYLTDIVAMAVRERVPIRTAQPQDAAEVMGVNDRVQLAQQEGAWQRRNAERLMREGVGVRDPARFDVRGRLACGRDVYIDIGVIIEGDVVLGDHVQIGPYSVIRNSRIGAGTHVEAHCVIDSADVGRACRIGPFARLRPQTRLGDQVHIGNFVELKKTSMGEGAKANHLAYLGDAQIGARVNVGAGVITCNYDGANKYETVIGDDAFIGTDSQLIAPLKIGAGAYIAAGSTIALDAPENALTICRAREQKTLAGWKRPRKIDKPR
jgi:bifunctional UDP-N-acetylglucosamine pyrophosphorylase/glucosamine-1-phosphate N-acetyltransferase